MVANRDTQPHAGDEILIGNESDRLVDSHLSRRRWRMGSASRKTASRRRLARNVWLQPARPEMSSIRERDDANHLTKFRAGVGSTTRETEIGT